jgi:hypothetical protein
LFGGNLKLKRINFYNNSIVKVEKGSFDELEEVFSVNFVGNPCYGDIEEYLGVKEIIQAVYDKCG